jgi:hypothetical protein
MGNKLMFPLCRKCSDEKQQDRCTCTDEQRMFWGTWPTCEVKKAAQLGYTIVEIAEVWHYDRWSRGVEGGLFAGYINAFLKIKQEASGYPKWAKTDADKQKYIDEYAQKEGIRLEKVEKNGSLRWLAKLFLNRWVSA